MNGDALIISSGNIKWLDPQIFTNGSCWKAFGLRTLESKVTKRRKWKCVKESLACDFSSLNLTLKRVE